MRTFVIRDPQGFVHTILIDEKGRWHGYENLAHGFAPVLRESIIREVQRAALAGLTAGAGFFIQEQP